MRKHRALHPEKKAQEREAFRVWREHNLDYDRERCNRYDAANREKRRQAIAQARAENPEHHRALRKAWREANIEQARAQCRAYWHRRRTGSDPSPDIDEYAEALMREPCAYCGTTEDITIDHVIPVSRGGKHVRGNLAPACRRCNSSKGSKPLDEWLGPPDELAA